jgi:antitoxin (DNA-binding transcriptional repressor) of toxin-antitoxin stability system
MPKTLTATGLRSNLYRVLDEVARSGEPQEVTRGGHRFLIVAADAPTSANLWRRRKRRALRGITADELVETSFQYRADTQL